MKLVITNVSSPPIQIYVSDLMTMIEPGASVTTTRAESDLSRMVSLQNYIAAGQLTMTAVPTLTEVESGTLGPIPPLIAVEEWDAPAAGVANAIMHSTATVNGTAKYLFQANSSVGVGYLVVPAAFAVAARNVAVTSNSNAQCPTAVDIAGLDAAGNPQTEHLALVLGAAVGVKGWSAFTSMTFTGGTGAAGTTIIGFGDIIGLKYPPMVRVGQTATGFAPVFPELQDGAAASPAGAIDATNHTYAPNDIPDGANKYALYYEVLQ